MTLSIDAANPRRIQFDTGLRRWFGRNLGLWRSQRQYFFAGDLALRLDMFLRIECFAEESEGEARYRFSWWPENVYGCPEHKPELALGGSMEALLCGHQLMRFSSTNPSEPVKAQIRQVDEHEVSFESVLDDLHVLEHIRLLDQDRYRSRSIYSWRNGDLEQTEMHHESRLEEAGPLLPLGMG